MMRVFGAIVFFGGIAAKKILPFRVKFSKFAKIINLSIKLCHLKNSRRSKSVASLLKYLNPKYADLQPVSPI